MTGPLSANPPGATLYFREKFRGHPAFPLRPGRDVHAVTVPGEAVVILPEPPQSYPLELTIHSPDAYSLQPTFNPDYETEHP